MNARGYWCIFTAIWAVFMIIISNQKNLMVVRSSGEKKKVEYAWWAVALVFLPVILWAGFRDGLGYVDTNVYITIYNTIPRDISEFVDYLKNPGLRDYGFLFYNFIIKFLFGEGHRAFILITALFQGISVINFFKKYAPYAVMSLSLFIVSTEYFGWMFNGMRQFMAVAIALYAVKPFIEKKYIRAIIIVLIASTFHGTAIILIPMGVLATGKPWGWKSLVAIVIAGGFLIATSKFTSLLDAAISGTQYASSVTSWIESGDDGVNPLRVLVFSLPTVLALLEKKWFAAIDDPVLNISINMSIMSTCLWLIAMVTSGIYMGRLPIYGDLFNYILLPIEINVLFTKNGQGLAKVLLVSMYLFFYYYQFHVTFGVF